MTKIHGKIGELSRRVKVGFVGTCEKYYTNETRYPMIRTTNLSEGGIDFTDLKYVTEEFYEKNKKSQLHDGDVLIARFGTSGTACVYHGGDAQCLNAIIVEPDLDTTIPEYLAIVINSRNVREQINRKIVGSTQAILNTKVLSDIEIDLPSIEVQHKIVKIFYSIQQSCSLRKREIEILDQLIKARFVEQFVSKNYPREDLDSLSFGKGEYGAQSASMEYDSSRPRYVRITDINDDGSLNDDYVCSTNTDDDETYKLTYGDFCFARMGATVGKTYAYKSGNQIFAGYLIRYRLKLDKIIPEYLYEFTRLDEYWNWVLLNQSGAAQPGINAKKYGSLMIPRAPLEEQQKFAEFVKQVDKSKVIVMKMLIQVFFKNLREQIYG